MPETPPDVVEAMQEDARAGVSRKDIAETHGVDFKTVDKYCGAILSEVRKEQKRAKPEELSREVTRVSDKALVKSFQDWFRTLTERQALEVLRAGRAAYEWRDEAVLRGLPLTEYIDQAFDFYENYVRYVHEIEKERDAYERLLEAMIPIASGEVQRLEVCKMRKLYVYNCLLKDRTPDKEVLETIVG